MAIRPEVTNFGTFALLLVHILNFCDTKSPSITRVHGINWKNDRKLDAAVIYKNITSWTMPFYVVFITDVSR
jgi:hypothetical protein